MLWKEEEVYDPRNLVKFACLLWADMTFGILGGSIAHESSILFEPSVYSVENEWISSFTDIKV